MMPAYFFSAQTVTCFQKKWHKWNPSDTKHEIPDTRYGVSGIPILFKL